MDKEARAVDPEDSGQRKCPRFSADFFFWNREHIESIADLELFHQCVHLEIRPVGSGKQRLGVFEISRSDVVVVQRGGR